MRALLFSLCVAVAGVAGYLLGSRDGGGHSREQAEYQRFEKDMVGFVQNNVVTIEMATLRKDLDLDPAQEKKVRAIVEERYRSLLIPRAR